MEKYINKVFENLKTANIVFLVFDLTDQTSFDSVSKWIGYIKQHCQNNKVLKILANKKDIGLLS